MKLFYFISWLFSKMKEKKIEQAIISYLKNKWAVVEWIQSWKIMIKKWAYNHRMTLQSAWCPDIIAFYKWKFLWIEVKKDKVEVDKWGSIRDRYYWIWKSLDGTKSYQREIDQIKYAELIEQNWGFHLITCDVWDVISIIEWIECNDTQKTI